MVINNNIIYCVVPGERMQHDIEDFSKYAARVLPLLVNRFQGLMHHHSFAIIRYQDAG